MKLHFKVSLVSLTTTNGNVALKEISNFRSRWWWSCVRWSLHTFAERQSAGRIFEHQILALDIFRAVSVKFIETF